MSNEPLPSRTTLYAKLAAVAGAIAPVEKDGYNPQIRYRYPTLATVVEAVKPLLAQHKLAIIPMINAVSKEDTGARTQSGAPNLLTRVELTYLIVCGESGESLPVPWVAEGTDWSDKGLAKALTIALRTFLIHLFQIPAEEESATETPRPTNAAPAQRPVPPATPPPARPTNGLLAHAPAASAPAPARDPREARTRFFHRYSEALGGSTWEHVQTYLGTQAPEPTTVEEWVAAAGSVRAKRPEATRG